MAFLLNGLKLSEEKKGRMMKIENLILGKIGCLNTVNQRLADISSNQFELLIKTRATKKELFKFYYDIKPL